MPVHIFMLLCVIVYAGEAVRIRKAKSLFPKASFDQQVATTAYNEATARSAGIVGGVSEEIRSARIEATRLKETSRVFRNTSSAQEAEHARVSNKTSKSGGIVGGVSEGTHSVRDNSFNSILYIMILVIPTLILCVCSWVGVAFRDLILTPQNFARRSHGPRDAMAVEGDRATDRSDLEWCHADKLRISGTLTSDIEMIAPNWNAESLKDLLHNHGVHRWTQEQLEHFAKELSTGKARLAKEDKSLLRVVDILIVLVVYERDQVVLREFAHPAFQGVADEEAYIKECTLKSRFRCNDGFMECAERCLQKLGSGVARFIEIVPDILGVREERRILRSAHPDLPTLMQYYVVAARVVATQRHDLEHLGLLSRRLHVAEYIYRWEDLDSMPFVKKHLLKSCGTSRQGTVMWTGLNHSLVPVLPWTEIAVLEKLKERNFPSCSVPPLDAMRSLLRALNEGRVALAVRRGDPPRLVCVTEKVSVVVRSPRKAMILFSGSSEGGAPLLPSVQRHTSESSWRAAVRLSQTMLGLSVPLFQMDGRVIAVSDAVEDQTVWEHVTREYILRGPLIN